MIEGQLSDEGLAAMSQNTDMTAQLAHDLANGIKESVEDLTATFKKMAIKSDKKKELRLFAQNECEVLTLLLDGFNISEISLSLKRSVSELESTMRSIRIKAADVLPAAAPKKD